MKSFLRLACSALLALTPLAVCGAQPARDGQALARLLARAGDEPLLALAVTDTWALPDILAETRLGKLVQDREYANGRAAMLKMCQEALGADPKALWENLRPHLAGPAALVLTAGSPGNDAAAAGKKAEFHLTLFLSASDAEGAAAITRLWPRLPREPGATGPALTVQTVSKKELLEGEPPPARAQILSQLPGPVRLYVRPAALRQALASWDDAQPRVLPEALQAALRQAGEWEIEALRWSAVFTPDGDAAERVQLDLLPEAKGPFARLVKALRREPKPWLPLQSALPGTQDLVFLTQADPAALAPDLPGLGQSLERFLRGNRWVKRHGRDPDVLAPERHKFLTEGWTGTLGFVSRLAASGEPQTVVALAYAEKDMAARREALAAGLAKLGGDFQTPANATPIGKSAPLAANFKGRGAFPAPVLNLSGGWLWGCSSPDAYSGLTEALERPAGTLEGEAKRGVGGAPESLKVFGPLSEPALRLRINLRHAFQPLYVMWLLAEGGPRLGSWKVPGDLLTPPGFFKPYLSALYAEAGRTERGLCSVAQGPAPGAAWVPIAVLGWLADGLTPPAATAAAAPATPAKRQAP